jgi:hypothetical protein
MITIKESADVRGLRPEVWEAIYKADEIYSGYGVDTVITSGLDSKHSFGSFHYIGLAVDLRTRHVPEAARYEIFLKLTEKLKDDYDVIHHQTHIHVEYDPRGKRYAEARNNS